MDGKPTGSRCVPPSPYHRHQVMFHMENVPIVKSTPQKQAVKDAGDTGVSPASSQRERRQARQKQKVGATPAS